MNTRKLLACTVGVMLWVMGDDAGGRSVFGQPAQDPSPASNAPPAPAAPSPASQSPQATTPPAPATPAASAPPPGPAAQAAPPGLTLGVRARVVQRIPVAPTVVVVSDPSSYARAVGSWSISARYPVLYDDGTYPSARRIARFVRAFAPKNVMVIPAPPAGAAADAEHAQSEWPKGRAERQSAMLDATASAWRDGSVPIRGADLKQQWAKLKFEPVGVVAADVDDPSWTGALALAAGRGQWLVFPEFPRTGRGDINGVYSAKDAAELSKSITDGVESSGFSYAALGDQIDALTLCFNGPLKYTPSDADATQVAALSDALGRKFLAGNAVESTRWAWAGQVVGNESQSAYMAMCSLFLAGDSGWFFDGYDAAGAFADYDLSRAGALWEKFGNTSTVDDVGRQGLEDWRRRCIGTVITDKAGSASSAAGAPPIQRGLDAAQIFVNTSGHAEYFDLKPGQGFAADLPFLRRPTSVYFVHSWSAATPAGIDTIAGRFLSRGAMQYVGSVQEPYLQGFLPPFNVLARYCSGMPWGAAVRYDNTGVWKIANIGDPLMLAWPRPKEAGASVGPVRLPEPAKLSVGRDLAEFMGQQLKAKDFPGAFRSLSMLGRDQDIVKLARAMLDDPGKPLSPPAALEAVEAVYFYGDSETFRRVFETALPMIKADSSLVVLLDMPWQVYSTMITTLRQPEADLLQQCVRPSPEALKKRDVEEATKALKSAAERGGK